MPSIAVRLKANRPHFYLARTSSHRMAWHAFKSLPPHPNATLSKKKRTHEGASQNIPSREMTCLLIRHDINDRISRTSGPGPSMILALALETRVARRFRYRICLKKRNPRQ
ncbi:hypothetical protein VTL71DRAFT_10090 [Oculimacula yallundae]|uniref:Uncharacterized protein n=1 Tax=Oculimacula yallundae TaxID=86028 RepID=A0ABR4BQC3_9HELO